MFQKKKAFCLFTQKKYEKNLYLNINPSFRFRIWSSVLQLDKDTFTFTQRRHDTKKYLFLDYNN